MDVGLAPDLPESGWEAGAAGVCGMVLTQAGVVRTTTWYVRDETGRLVREVRAQPGRPPDRVRRLTYDAAGRLATEEDWRETDGALHLGTTTSYERNARGVVTAVSTEHRSRTYATADPATDTWTTSSGTTPWAVDPQGRRVREGAAEGTHVEIGRDARGRITSVANVVHAGPLVTMGVDRPSPRPTIHREDLLSVVWAADGRSAVETLAWRRGETIEVRWTLDEAGAPLTNTAFVEPDAPEVATWLRDCATLPPVPP